MWCCHFVRQVLSSVDLDEATLVSEKIVFTLDFRSGSAFFFRVGWNEKPVDRVGRCRFDDGARAQVIQRPAFALYRARKEHHE